MGRFPISTTSVQASWFPWAIIMGVSFISIFNLLGYCTAKYGITTATIANKLSLVIPAALSLYLYNEPLHVGKIIGIALALPAVYLTTRVQEEHKKRQYLLIPALLFILSGGLDAFVKFVQHHFLSATTDEASYTVHVFAAAGIAGLIFISILAATGKVKLHSRNIIAGICLGIPNYFSIYLLIKLLNIDFFHSSAAIPVVNIGIVVCSTLAAILFFKEAITKPRIIGLALALVAILLIALNGRNL